MNIHLTTAFSLYRRAECHEKNKDLEASIYDYSRLLKQTPTNNALSLKLTLLKIGMGELDSAVTTIKECLYNDPDQRDCKKLFRRIKNLQKGLAKLEGMREKRKWRDVETFLYEEGFLADVEETGADKLLVKVYMFACSANHGVSHLLRYSLQHYGR